jgi:MraZ protein
MATRKTPYGWMALGGLLGLLGLGLACKLRDGSRAAAQQADAPPAVNNVPVMPLPVPGEGAAAPDDKKGPPPLAPLAAPPEPLPPLPEAGPPEPKPAPQKPVAPDFALPAQAPPPDIKPLPPVQATGPDVKPPPQGMPQFAPPLPPPQSLLKLPQGDPLVADGNDVKLGSPALPPVQQVGATDKPAQPPVQDVKPPEVPGVKPLPPPELKAPHGADARVSEPGEPPLAPLPGPVQTYQVRHASETLQEIARRTLGDAGRWAEVYKLNPDVKPDVALGAGTMVRLPGDACVPTEEIEAVKPLPLLRADQAPAKPAVLLPLTGTYPCNLDDRRVIALPKAIRDQLGGDTVLISPGPDHCLWLTSQAHLERLAKRLEASPAREAEVRTFKRLYFAQTEKATLGNDGRVAVPERLAQFAGLHQEVVLVGIDDHFELWDVARWRAYTQAKSAAARSAMAEQE